jgi:hypothetical protein
MIWYSIVSKGWCLSIFIQWAASLVGCSKEVQIVSRLFLENCYLMHVPRLPSWPGSSGKCWVIGFIWLELPWQYIAMTRNTLSIILIFYILLYKNFILTEINLNHTSYKFLQNDLVPSYRRKKKLCKYQYIFFPILSHQNFPNIHEEKCHVSIRL